MRFCLDCTISTHVKNWHNIYLNRHRRLTIRATGKTKTSPESRINSLSSSVGPETVCRLLPVVFFATKRHIFFYIFPMLIKWEKSREKLADFKQRYLGNQKRYLNQVFDTIKFIISSKNHSLEVFCYLQQKNFCRSLKIRGTPI